MKFLVIGLFLFFTQAIHAQLECVEGTWYLHILIGDLGYDEPITNINPPVEPTIIIEEGLLYTGIISCNNYSGNFTVTNDNIFTSNNFTRTYNDCDNNGFEDFYAGFFEDDNDFGPLTLTTCATELTFEALNGFGLLYKRFPPLSSQDHTIDSFILYPNPVSNSLKVSSETLIVEQIFIYNLQGALLQTYKQTETIDTSSLAKGIYFLKVLSEGTEIVQQFIKK